jgi:hypothetical protein
MSHIVVVTIGAHGHVNPSLPVLAELVRRGQRVTVAVPAPFAAITASAGATPLVYRSLLPDETRGQRWTDSALEAMTLFLDEAQHVLPQLVEALEQDRNPARPTPMPRSSSGTARRRSPAWDGWWCLRWAVTSTPPSWARFPRMCGARVGSPARGAAPRVAVRAHAGMGGCSEGLCEGVPMIAVPQAVDQFTNAQMLAQSGVAVVLQKTKSSRPCCDRRRGR